MNKVQKTLDSALAEIKKTKKSTLLKHFIIGFLPLFLLATGISYYNNISTECYMNETNFMGSTISGPYTVHEINDRIDEYKGTNTYLQQIPIYSQIGVFCNKNYTAGLQKIGT